MNYAKGELSIGMDFKNTDSFSQITRTRVIVPPYTDLKLFTYEYFQERVARIQLLKWHYVFLFQTKGVPFLPRNSSINCFWNINTMACIYFKVLMLSLSLQFYILTIQMLETRRQKPQSNQKKLALVIEWVPI